MSDEVAFLIQKDPKAFMDIVFTDDRNARLEKLRSSMEDIALCEIIRYGAFNDSAMIGPLAELYKNAVLPKLSEDRRWNLYRQINQLMDAVEFVSVNALLPFIAEEESKRIVSSAVIDYGRAAPVFAAMNGSSAALRRLVDEYTYGADKIEADAERAKIWFKIGVDNDDIESLHNLSDIPIDYCFIALEIFTICNSVRISLNN